MRRYFTLENGWVEGPDEPNGAISLTNRTTSAAIQVTQTGNASSSTSVGGAINLNNTSSSGAGMVIYSNHASSTARLLVVRADNAGFATQPVYVENKGTSHGILVSHQSTGSNANGVCVTSTNESDTALGVSGRESGKGTIKVTHNKPDGVADTNASAVSISLDRVNAQDTSAAQGIFIDSTHATTGKLLNIRNNGSARLSLAADGHLEMYEQSDASAPSANTVRIYCRDNGSGKTQLVARFPTGAVQQIAIEP